MQPQLPLTVSGSVSPLRARRTESEYSETASGWRAITTENFGSILYFQEATLFCVQTGLKIISHACSLACPGRARRGYFIFINLNRGMGAGGRTGDVARSISIILIF